MQSHNEVRLMPLTDEFQTCLEFEITSRPRAPIYSYKEIGGTVHHFSVVERHRELVIDTVAKVETHVRDPFSGVNLIYDDWSTYASDGFRSLFAEYLVASPFVSLSREARELALSAKAGVEGSVVSYLLALKTAIYEQFTYDSDVTHVHTTIDEVLALRAGVCQDFAHLMIGCCRTMGIPARYVSGYMFSEKDSGMRGHQSMHAWLECPLPDGRWLAIDPTNNLLANDLYVRVHVGQDYSEISPTRGIYVGAPAKSMDVTLTVERLDQVACGC
jgi:transglutaminase-like putative cysteine protease